MKSSVGFLALLLPALALSGEFRLASLFTDNMVLQQGRRAAVWGTAPEGAAVRVELNGRKAEARARNGQWQAMLPPQAQGGPYVLTASCGTDTLRFVNVLLGEVWVASGQSNMEWPLVNAARGGEEVAAAHYPGLRFFTVEKATSPRPLDAVKGRWVESDPENAPGFSAVAYFFARELVLKEGLNVGILHTSWGGTPAEVWTDEATLRSDPELAGLLGPLEGFRRGADLGRQEIERKIAEWEAFWDGVVADGRAAAEGWAAPEADLSAWTAAEVPGGGSVLSGIDGVVWYRRAIDVPADWAGRDLVLGLGAIDDYDVTYFNGVEVGHTFKDTPNWYMAPRSYRVPAALVRPGANTVAVRVIDNYLGGGFGGDPTLLRLTPDGAPAAPPRPLAGKWHSRLEFEMDKTRHPVRPEQGNESQVSTMLYNAMIAPLVPYGIRGAIWYQGEANASRFEQYRTLFPAMIGSWRRAWGQGDFPFYFVQLANYMQRRDLPSESEWAGLREAQTLALRTRNTGMAVAIDIGDAGDIHPRNKQDVGMRLALWARAKAYGRKGLEHSGPLFKSVAFRGGRAEVSFDHASSGLEARGGALRGFAVAGADGRTVWAEARIEGGKVIVSSPEVPEPRAVRYGWADNPEANLYNKAGLPASPFRTDGPKK